MSDLPNSLEETIDQAIVSTKAAIEDGIWVDPNATLETALPVFDRTGRVFVPVLSVGDEGHPPKIHGTLVHVDALRAYNRALAATAEEEHS